MGKIPEIPFTYGDLVSITGGGSEVIFWFKDYSGVIRGLPMDLSDPTNPVVGKDEILIKRKTEGQTRKKKMPPVGAGADASAR